MLSTRVLPAVCVYPDSDKIGVFSENPADSRLLFPRSAAVGYYHGEP